MCVYACLCVCVCVSVCLCLCVHVFVCKKHLFSRLFLLWLAVRVLFTIPSHYTVTVIIFVLLSAISNYCLITVVFNWHLQQLLSTDTILWNETHALHVHVYLVHTVYVFIYALHVYLVHTAYVFICALYVRCMYKYINL